MKKYIYAVILLIIIIFTFVPAALAETQDSSGDISYIEGTCLIQQTPDKEFSKARIGQAVFSSGSIKTLPESKAEITLPDGSTILVTEDSEITVQRSSLEQHTYTSIGLLFGSIRLFVKKLLPERQEFQVNTVAVTAGIRGTEFTATVREDADVLLQVDKGVIETEAGTSKFTITSGKTSSFSLSGERKDFKAPVDTVRWRQAAVARIKQNPEAVLKLMFEREKMIIERLKKDQTKLEEYRRNWYRFLMWADYLEKHGKYDELSGLIKKEKVYTLKVLVYLIGVRRRLAIIRSVLVLTAHIEKSLEPERAKKLPVLKRIRDEYIKINFIIRRIDETEQKLKKVLFVLNRKQRQVGAR